MFSVVIPLFNKAVYIEKALKSVISQTYQQFEVIIVDDGSTDDSFNKLLLAINKLQYNNIRIINQENQGVSVARNNGVKVAKYDYIAFLDADDWWESTYLEEMKLLIEEFPQAGIYGSSYYKVKDGNNIRANIGVEPSFKKGLINYCQVYAKTMYQTLWTGATILKRSIFESEHGFKPALKLGEDFDLWIRVAMKYPVVFLNKPLAYYNQDVEFSERAIGERYYKPQEHMLFTDYGEFNDYPDFRSLFEILAVYGLLPYYISGKYDYEVKSILSGIHWKNQALKYRLYYQLLPKNLVRYWFKFKKTAYKLKCKIN